MPEQINIPNDIYQKDVASIGGSCFFKLKISYFFNFCANTFNSTEILKFLII